MKKSSDLDKKSWRKTKRLFDSFSIKKSFNLRKKIKEKIKDNGEI